MSRLTDTQLVILSAASQRDDRGVELPANVKGAAAWKAADKLIRAGLLEEVRAAGSLPVWRRDDRNGPMALRITRRARSDRRGDGGGSQEDQGSPDLAGKNRRIAPDRRPSGFRCGQSARKQHQPGAKTKADPQESWPGSKQARVLRCWTDRRSDDCAIMRATHWQQHRSEASSPAWYAKSHLISRRNR
jgi:hypothetical protein